MLVAGVIFWFVRWTVIGKPTRASPFNLPLLLLLLTIPVSLFVTPYPETTRLEVQRLLSGILLCYCLMNWVNSTRRTGLVLAVFMAVTVALAGSALFVVNWADKFSFLPDLTKLFPESIATILIGAVNPNVMAGILILLLAGLYAWLIFRWGKLPAAGRIGIGLVILFVTAILILTQFRSAMIALAIALVLLVVLRFKRGWMIAVLAAIITVTLLFQIGPQKIWTDLGEVTGGTHSLTSRTEIWLRAGLILKDFPLTGIGMGTFGQVIDAVYPVAPQPALIDHAHNLYMQIALDLGIPGFLAWLACWLTILRMAWQLYRGGGDAERALGAAMLCSQCALGALGLVDSVAWDTRPAVILWAIWGLTAAVWSQFDAHRRMAADLPV